jgi:hypothetical protein
MASSAAPQPPTPLPRRRTAAPATEYTRPQASSSARHSHAATADDLKKSDATSPRWRSAGGSETVLQFLDAALGTHETSAPHWPCLIVLDGGQFSARCRFCRWISSPSQALLEVRSKGEEHACPGTSVRVPRGTTALWVWTRPIRRPGDLAATRPAGGGDATGYAPGSDTGT